MGYDGKSFTASHPGPNNELARLMVEYVSYIRDLKAMGSNEAVRVPGAAGGEGVEERLTTTGRTGTASKEIDIEVNDNGFPIMPINVMGDLTKTQLEKVLRTYLSAHYGTQYYFGYT
jgi:hypothetical protein